MEPRDTIPWTKQIEWNQVYNAIKRIDSLYGDKLENICKMATGIRQKYQEMSRSIETICSLTCESCEDICCVRATIWFDLKDLLYLYFGMKMFPDAQIIKTNQESQKKACCHFSEKGCTLNRVERPFVCTWYFCPVQTEYFKRHHPDIKQTIDQTLLEIKGFRNKIEAEFIRISYPDL